MPYFTEVAAPLARAQTSANLLASAVPGDASDRTWMSGVSWIGELCPQLEIVDPCAELDGSVEPAGGEFRFATPLGYRMRAQCTTMGGPRSYPVVSERLARQAEAVASFAVARELAEGAGATANPFDGPSGATGLVNQFFADANAETITGATSVLDALGLLEQEARDRTAGMQVFLHIPIRIATQVAAQLQRVGPELRTHTDAVVIADAGYTGRGPGAAPTGIWGYATGPVFAKLGPATVVDQLAATIDRRTNTQEIWADRMFLAGFDPCCQLAIEFPEP